MVVVVVVVGGRTKSSDSQRGPQISIDVYFNNINPFRDKRPNFKFVMNIKLP